MKVFLSYASEQSPLAQEIALALRSEGHDVFLDRSKLEEGEAYHEAIREAIGDSDLFVFLVSPQSVAEGRYTLTELRFAEEAWPAPAGHVLPVMVAPITGQPLPPLLRSVVALRPSGSVPAEVVAEVARLAKPRSARLLRQLAVPLAAIAVIGLAAGGWGIWRASQHRKVCGEAAGLAQQARVHHEAADYAAAWDGYAAALALCPDGADLLAARERLACDWLDNIQVRSGEQTFAEIVEKVQPALAAAAVSNDDRRAADALAHLGWGGFLKSREQGGGQDPRHYYQQALDRDPDNPYAHAMWGHSVAARGGAVEEVRGHFERALAAGRARPYVRQMQLAAYLWRSDPEWEDEIARVADSMRQADDPLPRDTVVHSVRWSIWNVYYSRLVSGTDRGSFLAALTPADHLATFQWLYPRPVVPDDKQFLWLYMLGQLQELAGDRAAALSAFRELSGLLAAMDMTSGRIPDGTREALRRLESAPR